jgi:C4-dicarboxylate-specific signal transduction histidine kinase
MDLAAQVISALLSVAVQTPALIDAGNQIVELLNQGSDPTPEQEASIRQTLEDINDELQAAEQG